MVSPYEVQTWALSLSTPLSKQVAINPKV